MATTSQIRGWWADRRCVKGTVVNPDRVWGREPIIIQPEYHQAVYAMFAALTYTGYVPEADWPTHGWIGSRRICPAGIDGKTCQPDGTDCSIHNYCLAIDLEYDKNPHLRVSNPDPAWMFQRCKITAQQVRAVEAIRTVNGQQVWRWLGWPIGDTMHFQANVSRPSILTGVDWSTVGDEILPPDMFDGGEENDMDIISKGAKGPAVVLVQEGLTGWKADSLPRYGTDGDFGNETETAVKAFQAELDLSQSGVVDGLTMGLLAMFMTGKKGPKGDPGEKGDKGDPGADAVLPDSIQIAIPPTIAEGHIG